MAVNPTEYERRQAGWLVGTAWNAEGGDIIQIDGIRRDSDEGIGYLKCTRKDCRETPVDYVKTMIKVGNWRAADAYSQEAAEHFRAQ